MPSRSERKSRAKFTQADLITASFPATGQSFWAQTSGPQGGDGIALTTNSSDHVFVGTQGGGVFRSTNNAETWIGINDGLTAINVRALAISPIDHIFAGTFGGVFRSTDNGDHWTAATAGLSRSIRSALSLPEQQDVEQECIAPPATVTVGRSPT